MTLEERADECAVELNLTSSREVPWTGEAILAHYDRRYRGEVWPVMELWISLFPHKLPPLNDHTPPQRGDMRWDGSRVRTWTGDAWWPMAALNARGYAVPLEQPQQAAPRPDAGAGA